MANRFTCVFEGNIRKIDQNPHVTDTPFGRAETVAVGDLALRLNEVEAILYSIIYGRQVIRDGHTEMVDWSATDVDRLAREALDVIQRVDDPDWDDGEPATHLNASEDATHREEGTG